MKTSIWLAAILGTALALTAQTPQKDQTRTQDRTRSQDQTRDQAQTQIRSRDQARAQDQLRKRDGSCGQTPGTSQRLGQAGGRGGRGR